MIEYRKFTNESGIYCFKNLINNKCYIGQAINLKKRLRSHYSAFLAGRNQHLALYKAINKYGLNNFDLSIIEFVDPNLPNLKEVLDELEKKYIKEYNSYGETGYNMTEGGDAGVLGLKMTEEQKEKIKKNVIEQNKKSKLKFYGRNLSEPKYYCNITYEDAIRLSGLSRNVICKICHNNNKYLYSKGWTFALTEKDLFLHCIEAFKAMANKTYSINCGKFIKNDPRLKLLKIQHYCKQKKKVLTEEQKQKISNSNKKKSVNQYDLNNNLITTFESVTQAAKFINKDVSTIVKCCKNKQKTAYGFIWKYGK